MEGIEIVIVEDEFVIAEDINTRLGQNGYNVLAVFDRAETALPFILEKRPDLIVVDIRLNGPMDGIEMVERVQREFKTPVIYITANSDAATYGRAKRTHPHAFLIKPFTPANLLAVVDLALYNFSSEQSPESIQRNIEPVDSDAPFLLN
jgi:DNA-binding response OmpR family regulator